MVNLWMATLLENKLPCIICNKEWIEHHLAEYYGDLFLPFCYPVKSNNPMAHYTPMNNLDYIEYLAKQRNLV